MCVRSSVLCLSGFQLFVCKVLCGSHWQRLFVCLVLCGCHWQWLFVRLALCSVVEAMPQWFPLAKAECVSGTLWFSWAEAVCVMVLC